MPPTQTADPGCPSVRRHGTAAAYNSPDRCRCPDARAAATRQRTIHRTAGFTGGLTDATGTRRRIEALMADGRTQAELAAELGVSTRTLYEYRHHPRVLRRTATAVAGMYRRLSGIPGQGHRTAARAAQVGLCPPAAWAHADIDDPAAQPWTGNPEDDDAVPVADTEPDPVAVERLLGSGPPPAPLAEVDARAFAAVAAAAGWSAERIAARAGVPTRMVRRWRHPAWAGPPAARLCEWCRRPIPYDRAEAPWRYRQRRYHEGECRTAGRCQRRGHTPARAAS